jgi:hypothetical protein
MLVSLGMSLVKVYTEWLEKNYFKMNFRSIKQKSKGRSEDWSQSQEKPLDGFVSDAAWKREAGHNSYSTRSLRTLLSISGTHKQTFPGRTLGRMN